MMEKRHSFATGMVLALGLLLVWMPIPLGSNRPWAWSLLELAIAILTLAHLSHCIIYSSPLVRSRWQWQLLLPLWGFIGFMALQLTGIVPDIATVDPYQTRTLLIKSVFFAFFILLVSQYCLSARLLRVLLVAIIISGCLQAFYGTVINLLQFENSPIWGYPEAGRARGSFVYQNHFANYLGLCLSLAIGWLISEMKTGKSHFTVRGFLVGAMNNLLSRKFILRLAIIIMIIGLILSRSRMGNAGFFTALGGVALLALFIYRNPPRLFKPLVLSIFVLDLIIVGSMFGLEKVKQRIEDTSFASETRDEVVIDSLPIVEQHWLAGTGGGSFYTVFPNYQPNIYSGFYDHAHNDYLQFALEFGIPATVLLGLWVLYAFWLACRSMYLRQEKLYRGIAFGCAMAIVFMLLHITVDFNLQSPSNALLFLCVLTCCYLVRYLPAETRSARA
ncbi:O-antigen ligase family protein [Shewanella sp. AS16]|uniref:O-antigen ligase family protein n=1 Tax=Shewanella sp. AS16 TaxID=2907625 RepID=UPI001F221A68|nr:O-antigen ligase family protein [Shewanella sp. AS16]MCE9686967.1 O-antigen ligase family protein [Shewanella sp. AS16]